MPGIRLLRRAGISTGASAMLIVGVIRSFLFGMSATDPVTLASGALLLAGVGLVVCYLPARRAAGVDPMIALRDE